MAEYVKKEELLDEAYWHGDRYTVQNPYPSGVEAVDVEDIEKIETINIVKCKNCKYHIYDEDSCSDWCEHSFMTGIVKPDFYCACGHEGKTQEKPFPSVVGQPAEMFCNGKWEKGKIVAGYRFNDGIVTIETEDGKRLWCGQDRTDIYRPYREDKT